MEEGEREIEITGREGDRNGKAMKEGEEDTEGREAR